MFCMNTLECVGLQRITKGLQVHLKGTNMSSKTVNEILFFSLFRIQQDICDFYLKVFYMGFMSVK